MLRASSKRENLNVDLNAVVDSSSDPGVAHGSILRALTEATIEMRWDELDEIRSQAFATLGEAATVDALAVASGFNGITRVADATGIPIDNYEDELGRNIRAETGIDDYHYTQKYERYG